jgi:hypothetical protein
VLSPPAPIARKAEAQSIVLSQQACERSSENRRAYAIRRLEADRLIEVVPIDQCAFKEPMLDRSKRKRSGNNSLVGFD